MLRLSEIAVDLGGFALRVDSLELAPGEYLVILGPNGAGKTVLLETIAGLHPVEKGRIEFREASTEPERPGDGWTDVTAWPPEKRRVGFVYQDYLLFPHLSVSDNIGFGLKGRVPTSARADRVREAAKLTGVEGLSGRRVARLSGGEQQRVALARALAIRPRLLLLDEPLAALDRSARREMADEVRRLCRDLGVTVLHVTHSLEEAVSLGDRVAVLADGGLLQIGPPRELLRGAGEQTGGRTGGLREPPGRNPHRIDGCHHRWSDAASGRQDRRRGRRRGDSRLACRGCIPPATFLFGASRPRV